MTTIDLDPLDFFATLQSTAGLSVVVFVKRGCGACRAMRAALEQLELDAGHVTVFVVDGEDGPGLIADFEVFHFPALFLWRDGEYHAQLQAAPTPVALGRAIQAAAAHAPEPEPGERVD